MSEDVGNSEEKTDAPANNSNDLVIRDGFPALRLPGGKGPWIDGIEPIPRHSFWGEDDALQFDLNQLEMLWKDCECVFSARTRDDSEAYSAGLTYFCPSQMKPRCALEALALSIFRLHTEGLEDGVFVPEQSGAEWWTLILDDDNDNNRGDETNSDESEDEEDEVGLHFDADYGLEEQAPNLLLHPRVATVTYLSDFGAPTVIFNKRSPPPGDVEKKTLEGDIDKAWLSHPKIGKHIAFDGRLLHGAPSEYFPARANEEQVEPPLKKAKQPRRRITMLVNVWLNHCPLDAEILDDETVEQLKCPWVDSNGKTDDSYKAPFTWKTLATAEPPRLAKSTVSAEGPDQANSEEVVICGRLVNVSYGVAKDSLRKASSEGSMVQIHFGPAALALQVGEEVQEDGEESD